MSLTKIGKITHYYDKIGVAVVELLNTIKKGDKLKISGHDNEFSQNCESMQMEHLEVSTAKKGDTIGMKVNQAVKEGDFVYLEGKD